MKAAEWIDRVKASKGLGSDYAAAKTLKIKATTISWYRRVDDKTMDEETAVSVADALGVDPIIVLADQAMERSRTDKARSAWAGILSRIIGGQEKTPHGGGVGIGGDEGIRTLDAALHRILP